MKLINVVLTSMAFSLFATRVFGDGHNDPRFAMHRKATTTKSQTICTTYSPNATNTECLNYITSGLTGYSLVYFTVVSEKLAAIGLNGASFGIDYDGRAGQAVGIDPNWNTWTPCFDGQVEYSSGGFGDFPAPKGGIRVGWSTCQHTSFVTNGVHAIVGALSLYAYSADVLRITPNFNVSTGPELMAVRCNGDTMQALQTYPSSTIPWLMGRIALGGGSGYVPCGLPLPGENTTWGQLKARYR